MGDIGRLDVLIQESPSSVAEGLKCISIRWSSKTLNMLHLSRWWRRPLSQSISTKRNESRHITTCPRRSCGLKRSWPSLLFCATLCGTTSLGACSSHYLHGMKTMKMCTQQSRRHPSALPALRVMHPVITCLKVPMPSRYQTRVGNEEMI